MAESFDVLVIGAGPAGTVAAVRAAELGARTALLTHDAFGGMAANDGPVPVRTLAYAAHLYSRARRLEEYGVSVGTPRIDFARLLERVRTVVGRVSGHSAFRDQIDRLGVALHEHAGMVRFVDPHTVETTEGVRFRAAKIIVCAGGTSRKLAVPGAEHLALVSDAWRLTELPESLVVIGAGMTGVQVASIFQSFGTRVYLFQSGPRILPSEDEDVSSAVAASFRNAGMMVRENIGAIDSLEKIPGGIRMSFSNDGTTETVEASLAVSAVGWIADTEGLKLGAAGVTTNERGFIAVDANLRTSSPHIYAAGDITGRWMLVPQAIHDGWAAATHAVRGTPFAPEPVCPIGGFTDPEYARVGLTETQARAGHDAVVAMIRFDETTRTIIDGRTDGFCKLLANRRDGTILGCHVVGERAVEMVQIVAVAMTSGMTVDRLARVPLSFPTYTGILGRAAYRACLQLERQPDNALGPDATF